MMRKLFLNVLTPIAVLFTVSTCSIHFPHPTTGNNVNSNSSSSGTTFADVIPPVVGEVAFNQNDNTAPVNVSWDAATDNVTLQAKLKYKLVKALNAADVNSIAKVDAIMGNDVIMDWKENVTQYNVMGLTSGTMYYFGLIVKDEAGNKSQYLKLKPPIWTTVGNGEISGGMANYIWLALDSASASYLAYQDGSNPIHPYGVTVKKYDGAAWVNVGLSVFSGNAAQFISIAIDPSDTPYVAYQDWVNSCSNSTTCKAVVQKFDKASGSWQVVSGSPVSDGKAQYVSMAIDANGTPYVAYQDWLNSYKVTVKKFDKTSNSWQVVGAVGLSDDSAQNISLAIDPSGAPYVAYQDWSTPVKKVTVKKFDGTSWQVVGVAGLSVGLADCISLAIDANGAPYVAYQDAGNSFQAVVQKYNKALNSWQVVGSPLSGGNKAIYISLAIDRSGMPYVAYQDVTTPGKAMVKSFSGNVWKDVSPSEVSSGAVQWTSLVLDRNGTPYLAYEDTSTFAKVKMIITGLQFETK